MREVIIKTDIYDFCGVRAGDIGTIVREAKNYYGQRVFDVKVGSQILIFTEDEVEGEMTEEGKKQFYVSLDNEDLVVMEEREDGEDRVVGDKYKTKFMLCSGRCARKEHYGEFDSNIFKCYFYDLGDTHPLQLLTNQLKAMERKDGVE